MTSQLRLAQPPFRHGIAPVGIPPTIFGPCPGFVYGGPDLDGLTGGGIPDGRAGQAAHGNFDLDERPAPVKRLETDVAVLDDGSVDRVGHRRKTQVVPEAVDTPELTVGGECHAIDRRGRGVPTGAQPCFLLGQTIGALKDAVSLVDIERLIPETGERLLIVTGIGKIPPVAAARLEGNEVAQVISNVLLNGVVCAEMGGDFGIDLVPRSADLTLEIAPERGQVLVKLLGVTRDLVSAPHALALREIIDRQRAAAAVDPAAARTPTITRDMSARMSQLLH